MQLAASQALVRSTLNSSIKAVLLHGSRWKEGLRLHEPPIISTISSQITVDGMNDLMVAAQVDAVHIFAVLETRTGESMKE